MLDASRPWVFEQLGGELKDEMINDGIKSLRMAGIAKVKQGTTTIDEVLRVSAADRR